MTTEKVDFTDIPWRSVQWTMLVTLYLRAYESRNEQSVLADHAAAEAVDRIEYDFDRMKRSVNPASTQYVVALRAKQLDEWTTDFLERHPNAVVLHLGCGLDSRAFRLELPPGVTWYDVDVPQVIDLRRRIYPEADRYQMIGSSVTEPEWLDKIPSDRPVLIVAEGLLPYLEPDDVRTLLRRLTDRFQTGELCFDGLPPWVVPLMKFLHWGTRDEREVERWNPRLHCVEKTYAGENYQLVPDKRFRRLFGVIRYVPLFRRYSRLFRFTF